MAKSKLADTKVTELMAHGYSKTAATRALHDAHNDTKRALDILQTQQRKAERAAAQQERIRQAAAATTTTAAGGDGGDGNDGSGDDKQHEQQQQQQQQGERATTATRRVLTHPCIDVFGKCAYGQQCMLRHLPRNACIHHYHGSCVFGDACQRAHYDADGVDIAAHRKQRLQQQQSHTLTVNGQVYTLTRHARGGVQTAVVAAPPTQREQHHGEYDDDEDDSSSSSGGSAHDGEDNNGAAAVVRPVPYLERLRRALGTADNNNSSSSSGKHHKSKKSSRAAAAAATATSPSSSSSSPSIALHPCIAQFGNCRFGAHCRYLRCPADVCVNHLHNCCYRAPGTCPYRHIHIGERQRQEQQQQQQQQQQQREQSYVPTIRATSSASSSSTSATSSSAAAAMSTWLSPHAQHTTASACAAAEAAAVAPPRSSTASLHNNNSNSNSVRTTTTAMAAAPAASRSTQLTTSAVAALMQQIHDSTHTLGLGRAAGATAYNNNNNDQGDGGDDVLYDVDEVCDDDEDDDDDDEDALQQALYASQGDDEDDMACSDAELQKLVRLQELFAHTEMYWLLLTLRACGGDVQAAANNLLRQEDEDNNDDNNSSSGGGGGEQDADADDIASDAALAQALADEEEEAQEATTAAAAAVTTTAAGVDAVHNDKSSAQLLGTRTEALLTLCTLFPAAEPRDVEAALCECHDDYAAAYELLRTRSAALPPTRNTNKNNNNNNNKSNNSKSKSTSSARGRRNAWEGVTNMQHMQRAHLDALVARYAGSVDGDVVHCVHDAVGGDVRTARDVLDQMVSAMCASSAMPPARKGQQQRQTTLTTTTTTAARTPAALLARQRALLQRPATAAARLCANSNNNNSAAAAAAACGGALSPRVVTAQHADDSDADECGGDAAAAAATRHTLASLSCDDVAHEYRAVAAEVQQYGDWMRVRRESYRVNACRLRAIRRAGEAFACGDAHAGRLWSGDARRLGAAYARLKRIALLALEQQRASSSATNVLDLHGFHADEVAGPLRRRVHLCRKRHIRRLRIVVGEGKHSVGGVSRLMPTVRALLRSDAELAAHVRLARLHQGYMDVRVLF